MDLLKAEIARKRAGVGAHLNGAKRFVKRSELLAAEEEERRRKQAEAHGRRASPSGAAAVDGDAPHEKKRRELADEDDEAPRPDHTEDPLPEVKESEVHRRLRHLGEPICLFGETLLDKRRRLRELEMLAADTIRERQRNDFQDAMQDVEEEVLNELAQGREAGLLNQVRKKPKYRWKDMRALRQQLGKHDSQMDMTLVRRFFRYLLDLWGYDLDGRPKEVRDSPEGRLASAVYRQTSEYLKPLFRMLKDKTASTDIVRGVREIVDWLVQREYINANDAYLRLAIGNAAWPIGVTNVGIHSRTGREKIFSQNIAHVLNDETQRKYIQAVKRLMTFCQKRFPNVPSKCLEYRGLQKGLYPVSYEAADLDFDSLPDDSTPPASPTYQQQQHQQHAQSGDDGDNGPTPA